MDKKMETTMGLYRVGLIHRFAGFAIHYQCSHLEISFLLYPSLSMVRYQLLPNTPIHVYAYRHVYAYIQIIQIQRERERER